MTTNIGLLPQLSGSFITATNSDWRYAIPFVQPSPNQASPLDLSGIGFVGMLRRAASDPSVLLNLSTNDGTLTNGGATGLLTIAVGAARMAQLPPGLYVFDIVAFADAERINLFLAAPASVQHGQGVTR